MRTLNFSASAEPAPQKRAGTLAIAALVHVLALVAVVSFDRQHFADSRAQSGAPARFFVDVFLPVLAQRPPAAPALATAVTRAPLEVLVTPRAVADTVRLQMPPSRAAEEAPTEASAVHAGAAPAPAPAVAVPAPAAVVAAPAPVPVAAPAGVRDDTPKVIAIESMGMSSATYTFPALTGESGSARPRVFKVEIGAYRDIELAIVNHVIEQIRARYPNEITWDSREKGGMVRLSMRLEDHDLLVKFLRIELFGRHKASTY
jgi:hypothetical protein